MAKIAVVGSCMIDLTSYCSRLPREGETIHGSKFCTTFGGKGANQCIAAAKLGAQSALVARLGDDAWGQNYLKELKDLGIITDFVQLTPGITTGTAQINVADSGANQIVIVAAANLQLSVEDVCNANSVIENAEVVICQLETRPDVAIKALELCKKTSILNAAPALTGEFDNRLLTLPSIFCVNEIEATTITNITIETVSDANLAVQSLIEKGCNIVILTLGVQGTVFASKSDPTAVHVATREVKSVDSTGAGDAFIGALAYFMVYNKKWTLKKCIEAANFVAADSVTRMGSQSSFPDKEILKTITTNLSDFAAKDNKILNKN